MPCFRLQDNVRVTSLDLSSNDIQAEGCKYVAEMLTANDNIIDVARGLGSIVKPINQILSN